MFELQLNQGVVLLRKAVAQFADLANITNVSPKEVILPTAGNAMISEEDFVILRFHRSRVDLHSHHLHHSLIVHSQPRSLVLHLNRAGEDLIGFSDFFPFALQ